MLGRRLCPSPEEDDTGATTGNRSSLNVVTSRVEESQEEKLSVSSSACGGNTDMWGSWTFGGN